MISTRPSGQVLKRQDMQLTRSIVLPQKEGAVMLVKEMVTTWCVAGITSDTPCYIGGFLFVFRFHLGGEGYNLISSQKTPMLTIPMQMIFTAL